MNILVANNSLKKVGGTESFSYTLIEELILRGYQVEYFTFKKGIYSEFIEKNLGVQFMSRKKYHLILANHNTCVNFLHKKGFIIQTCHGISPKVEQPSYNADAHVSISHEVQQHLAKNNLPSIVILNGINCNRFKPIKPIKNNLSSILSLSHSNSLNQKLQIICNNLNIHFLKLYKYSDNIFNVENYINKADLVVGLGRSSYESIACGRPVVIYDEREYNGCIGDGYLQNNIALSIIKNCSGRYYRIRYNINELQKEILKYNAEDSDKLRNFALYNLNIEYSVDRYLEYYREMQHSNRGSYSLYKKSMVLIENLNSNISKVSNKLKSLNQK